MATKVHMEALSPTMEEGQIVKWHKSEGDEVASGDLLAEIETDKATMELLARGEGVLRQVLLEEGATAPVGEVIAIIAGADEDLGDDGDGNDADDEAREDDQADVAEAEDGDEDAEESGEPKPASKAEADEAPPSEADTSNGERRVRASPLARRLAEEKGLTLQDIEGSGPGGRIVKRDVEAAEAPPEEEAPETEAPEPTSPATPESEADYEDIPLSQIRKTIAKRLVQSIGPVPHFFLTVDVDMSRVVAARGRINKVLESEGVRVSFNDIVLKATALALAKHPECNAHWGGDHVRRFNRVHLGVAVAIEDGLITPVIRDAHRKGLAHIAQEVRELAGRARDKKLSPDEYTGSTFSVSNLGMFGIEDFTAVINPPEAGILAVGALEERPVVVDGEIRIQPRMKITMSCDHRVIDGALGSRFLQTLTGILEEPLLALV
ncbi:MAG: pyruvate dehydrogenase complex dihydrolipoamide acetyltransferase [Gemmatimonadales bacterium]|nr:MAG: pyruvate dehydrogenase complex dihydrolipoamide acetyltransferase [Gemmatimonadales bacterium]